MNDTNQTILITGTSSGFGRLAAETLARMGYHVFAGMRATEGRNEARCRHLLDLAASQQWALEVVELDVTDDAAVDRAAAHVVEVAGHIDVVINNAGTAWVGVTEGFTVDQAQRLFDTNLFGAMRVNRAVLPHMRAAGRGLLMHVTSGVGRVVFPFSTLYSSSKWALEGYAEGLRYELAPLGVDAVIVEPGVYPTEIVSGAEAPREGWRGDAYGETAGLALKFGEKFAEIFGGDDPPNPQAVVDAMARLIETPVGSRPLRTLVGFDAEPLAPLNALSDTMQRQVLRFFELDPLLATSPAPEA